jgi:hypothetical protein
VAFDTFRDDDRAGRVHVTRHRAEALDAVDGAVRDRTERAIGAVAVGDPDAALGRDGARGGRFRARVRAVAEEPEPVAVGGRALPPATRRRARR